MRLVLLPAMPKCLPMCPNTKLLSVFTVNSPHDVAMIVAPPFLYCEANGGVSSDALLGLPFRTLIAIL
jgi:hypothetical protein